MKCKICRNPNRKFKTTCSIECEAELGLKLLEKQKRIESRKANVAAKIDKEKLKRRSKWLAEAQVIFNRYIRLRDTNDPCISCGRKTGCKINAGHYLSVGSHPHLRFNEDNCHAQCEYCNHFKSGNQAAYRPRLIEKIGVDRVEALESNNEVVKWTIEDLRQLKIIYQQKLRGDHGKMDERREGIFET